MCKPMAADDAGELYFAKSVLTSIAVWTKMYTSRARARENEKAFLPDVTFIDFVDDNGNF